MMRGSLRLVLVLTLPFAVVGVMSFAQEVTKPPSRADFMKLKLVHAQKILEGIAKEDYDEVAKNAQAMSLLTMEEQWKVLTTEKYLQQSRTFRDAADSITDAAKDRNLDAISLAYVDMTLSCVKCHKQLRAAPKQTSPRPSAPSR